MKTFGTLALAALLSLAPLAGARADVWLMDIVQVQAGTSGHYADSYLGALDLLARRHGGIRVSRFRENLGPTQGPLRLVGLWRFPTNEGVEALLADPSYASIRRLRQTTIDAEKSSTLELVADGAVRR